MISSHLKLFFYISFCVLCFPKILMALSPFRASVDRTSIESGGSLTLRLEMTESVSEAPNFSELRKDFDILSQSNSRESQYINGHQSSKTTWTLEISPKSDAKTLTIPALKLGQYQSNPITISQGSGSINTKDDKNIEFKAFVDTNSAYIKQQIILTIELKTSLPLHNGSIEKPQISDAIVESLGEDEVAEDIENGIKIHKFKRQYALFFTSPTKTVIEPIKFEGTMHRSGSSMRGLIGYFPSGQRIRAKSNPIEITIKDVPSVYPKSHPFLPLKSFIISESLDNNETFKVSKATARKFELRAMGTLSSFLPVIEAPQIENIQIYAEPGEKIQKNTEDGIEASNSFSHVYIPLAPQKLTIPAQEIYWWDTVNNEVKTVTIRALDTEITGTAMPPSLPRKNDAPLQKNDEPLQAPTAVLQQSNDSLWPVICLALLVLWLLTIGYFVRSKGRLTSPISKYTKPIDIDLEKLIKNIIDAIDQNSPKKVLAHMQTLKNYSQAHPDDGLVLSDDFFRNLATLEASLYQPSKNGSINKPLNDIKAQVLTIRKTKETGINLKTLYPS